MSKIRKRSFTNYENSIQRQEQLLDQVIFEQNATKNQNQNPESFKRLQKISLGLVKSKKAKLFSKFQNSYGRTARQSTENGNISTIASLKKQIAALQNEQVTSYRFLSTKNQNNKHQQEKDIQNKSQVQLMMQKFRSMRKLPIPDKSRGKFVMLKLNRIHTQSMKTNRSLMSRQKSSIKNQILSTRSDNFFIKNQKIQFNNKSGQKQIIKRQKYFSQKGKQSMSLTAKKFYQKKSSQTRFKTQTSLGIYQRQKTIKKLIAQDRVFSKSVLSL